MAVKKKRRKTNPHAEPEGKEQPSILSKNLAHCDLGMSPLQQKLPPLEQRIGYKDD